MKNKFRKLLDVNVGMLTILLSVFLIFSCSEKPLVAANKKDKNHKKNVQRAKKIQEDYAHLQNDYQYTLQNFVDLLNRLVTIYDELDTRIQELEKRYQGQEQELYQIKEVFNRKAEEDETFRLGIQTPFFEEPVYINGIHVERHKVPENPY